MKKHVLLTVGAIVVVAAIAAASYSIGKKTKPSPASTSTEQSNSSNQTSASKIANSSPAPTPVATAPTKTIKDFDASMLFYASQTRKLTDLSTKWQDSPVTVNYADYNKDGVTDAFVWAKLPGTKGFSFAAVWTIGTGDVPKELWFVPSAQQFVQSSWSFSGLTFTEKGSIESPNGLDPQTNEYYWNGSAFVTK